MSILLILILILITLLFGRNAVLNIFLLLVELAIHLIIACVVVWVATTVHGQPVTATEIVTGIVVLTAISYAAALYFGRNL